MGELSNFTDYMVNGIVWMPVCEDCKNDIEERIRNPEGERNFLLLLLTNNTPVLGSQTLCSRCYVNDGKWKPAAFLMEWWPPRDKEEHGWPTDADHLIPNSECRWCGTGSVTVDSEWHMCGDCAYHAMREKDANDADIWIGAEEGERN